MTKSIEMSSDIATLDVADVGRRNLPKMNGTGIAPLCLGAIGASPSMAQAQAQLGTKWDKTFPETAYTAAAEPKELMIIPGAVHTDLYDRVDVIPFDKLTAFFQKNLATPV